MQPRGESPQQAFSQLFFSQQPDPRLHSCPISELALIIARGWERGCRPCCHTQHPDIHLLEQSSKPTVAKPSHPSVLLPSSLQMCFSNSLLLYCIDFKYENLLSRIAFAFVLHAYLADLLKAVWLVQQIWMRVYQLHWRDCTEGFLSAYFKLGICSC